MNLPELNKNGSQNLVVFLFLLWTLKAVLFVYSKDVLSHTISGVFCYFVILYYQPFHKEIYDRLKVRCLLAQKEETRWVYLTIWCCRTCRCRHIYYGGPERPNKMLKSLETLLYIMFRTLTTFLSWTVKRLKRKITLLRLWGTQHKPTRSTLKNKPVAHDKIKKATNTERITID